MLEGLDDVSTKYLTPEAYDRALEETDDDYEGIGAFVNVIDGQVILSPMRGGPADVGGIQAGDVLIEVEGQSLEDLSADEAVSLVRGPARSKVHLKVARPDEERPLEFDITRGTIEVPTVDVQLLPGAIGYIYVSEFNDTTPNEVLDLLERLKAADMLALILDLRSDTGGLLDSARRVAGEFLPTGTFMYEMDRFGNRTDHVVEGEGTLAGEDEVPMAVLVSGSTTDALEALAGALQDAGRAEIIGVDSKGDGAGFSYFPLEDGSAMQLAVTRWHTPAGRLISEGGIAPDIELPLSISSGGDSQLARAYDYLNELLPLFR
jgi:carboxyl-terminal processing protease